MTKQVTFRRGTLADAPRLAQLRWDFSPDEIAAGIQPFEEFAREFTEWLAVALAGDEWVIWLAELDGRVIANMYVRKINKLPRPGRFHDYLGYVTNVYTEPEFRSQGIGSALLQHVIAWAREEHLVSLLLWPAEESVEFYLRNGFARRLMGLEL